MNEEIQKPWKIYGRPKVGQAVLRTKRATFQCFGFFGVTTIK